MMHQEMYKHHTGHRKDLMMAIVAIFLVFAVGESLAANYPLEIIQPSAGLDTKNRFYKAYPGLEYNVRMAVIGGAYPFTYSLTTAPSGMTIDSRTGTLTWPSPTASSNPYTVTATVTDQEGASASVSWPITVTTTGFIFVDAANGKASTCNGGSATGTISAPYQTIKDWYCTTKANNTNTTQFVYYRTGTYMMNAPLESCPNCRIALSSVKPMIHMAYPGESPVFDMTIASLQCYGGCANFYVDGVEFINITNQGGGNELFALRIDSNANYITIRRNNFHGLTAKQGSYNQSMVMFSVGSTSSYGLYWSFQDNILTNIDHGYGLLGYNTSKTLVEDNACSNIRDTLGNGAAYCISPKADDDHWFIRNNRCSTTSNWCYNLQSYQLYSALPYGNIEVSYNTCTSSPYCFTVGHNISNSNPAYVTRNTFLGPVEAWNVASTSGPYYFSSNVIVNSSTATDKIDCISCSVASRLVPLNNLSGTVPNNITNSVGNLTSAYLLYLGSRGYQISSSSDPPPDAPQNLDVK